MTQHNSAQYYKKDSINSALILPSPIQLPLSIGTPASPSSQMLRSPKLSLFYMQQFIGQVIDGQLQQLFLSMKILENSPKIAQIESRLAKYTYLSRNNLPGYLDAVFFQSLKTSQKYPDRAANPNLYHWYILMRQFAPSTINRWIEDRIYYDPEDALVKSYSQLTLESSQTSGSVSPGREETIGDLKSPKLDSCQIEYVIDVLVKQCNQEVLGQLRRCLENYKVEIIGNCASREVRINCGSQSARRQEIANIISKTVEYENLQVKREKKSKTSLREEPQ